MKVVILAAGRGSRLDQSDQHLPKPLTQLITHQSILEYQLERIQTHISLRQVIVVVGYQKESIMKVFPNLVYVTNDQYQYENTAKSLERALQNVEEDVLWLNGDVVFHVSVLQKILEKNKTSMVVNHAVVGEEEVKFRADSQGRILEVSKQVLNPMGEALGINLFKKEDLPILKKNLALCEPMDYFEKAIEGGIQNDQQIVWSIPVQANLCMEIDFREDLAKANEMLLSWSR